MPRKPRAGEFSIVLTGHLGTLPNWLALDKHLPHIRKGSQIHKDSCSVACIQPSQKTLSPPTLSFFSFLCRKLPMFLLLPLRSVTAHCWHSARCRATQPASIVRTNSGSAWPFFQNWWTRLSFICDITNKRYGTVRLLPNRGRTPARNFFTPTSSSPRSSTKHGEEIAIIHNGRKIVATRLSLTCHQFNSLHEFHEDYLKPFHCL